MCQINTNDIIMLINSLDMKNVSESYKTIILRHVKAMFNFATNEGVK